MALTKISTGGVKDDAASQAKIADEAVDEARLQISNGGTNGQFLQKTGNTGGLTWATVSVPDSDKIEEGNTSVETVDTGSDGHVSIKTEGTERLKVRNDGIVDIGGTGANTVNFNVKGTAGSGAGLTGHIGKVNIGSSYSSMPNAENIALGQLIFGHGTTASGPIIEGSAGGSWSTNNLPSALKFYTVPASSVTQTERLRISKDGAFGVGGANYGTSGQVLTSGGSSAAPSWAELPVSGGILEAVANGSIANGAPVILESDGKVKAIAGVSAGYGTQQGPANTFEASPHDWASSCYVGNNRYVLMHRSGQDIKFYIGTIDATNKSVSYGSTVSWTSIGPSRLHIAADTATGDFVATCLASSGDRIWVRAGTAGTSGNSISLGSAVQHSSAAAHSSSVVYIPTTNHFLLVYNLNSTGLRASVATRNGTSTSFGTQTLIRSGNCHWIRLCYDSTADRVVTFYKNDSNDMTTKVVQVATGGGITAGSELKVGDNTSTFGTVCHDPNTNTIFFAWRATSFSNKLTGRVGTVSGNSITLGSLVHLMSSGNSDGVNSVYVPLNKKIYLASKESSATSNDWREVVITGTTPSLGASYTLTRSNGSADEISAQNTGGALMFDPDNNCMVIIAAAGRTYVYQFESSNMNAGENSNLIGLSTAAYSNGDTASITITGGINESQSSLTPAKTYYVNKTGGLQQTTDSFTSKIGIAVTATKLLVK